MATPVCPQPQFNTYIGARYVPVFAGTWNNTQTYEPLMIVQYQGNSYTSKTYVPAGVDITNDTYWAITGNYNAQIEEYRREVKGVSDQLDVLETDINGLKTSVNNLDSITASHSNQLNILNPNVNYLSYFKGKRVLILGDSMSDQDTPWGPELMPNWVDKFIDKLGNVCSSITNNSLSSRSISDVVPNITCIASLVDSIDFNNFDIVIMFAGFNDYGNGAPFGTYYNDDIKTFYGALNHIASKVNNSNAVMYCMSPVFTNISPTTTLPFHSLNSYRIVMYQLAISKGWHFIDGFNAPMLAGNFSKWSGDGLHPFRQYAPFLCDYIIQQIVAGNSHSISNIYEQIEIKGDLASIINTSNFTNGNSWFTPLSNGHISLHLEGTIISTGLLLTFPEDFKPYKKSHRPAVGRQNAGGGQPLSFEIELSTGQVFAWYDGALSNISVCMDFEYYSNTFGYAFNSHLH